MIYLRPFNNMDIISTCGQKESRGNWVALHKCRCGCDRVGCTANRGRRKLNPDVGLLKKKSTLKTGLIKVVIWGRGQRTLD